MGFVVGAGLLDPFPSPAGRRWGAERPQEMGTGTGGAGWFGNPPVVTPPPGGSRLGGAALPKRAFMRSRSSGLMRMQVSESVSVKIWARSTGNNVTPRPPPQTLPCPRTGRRRLGGAVDGGAEGAQHLTCRKMRSSSSGSLQLSLG